MKISRLALALVSAVLLFASFTLADEANKTTVRFNQKITVDGKTLDSGKYTAQWTGEGPNVQVTLLRGKDAVATFAAQIKQEATPNPTDAIGTTDGPDGSKQLTSIYPNGKRVSIQVGSSDTAAPGGSPSR
jgi:hypothetical protein